MAAIAVPPGIASADRDASAAARVPPTASSDLLARIEAWLGAG
jgi:hypothetical protein